MRKLLVILSFLFIAATSFAQPVDFSTYERVIRRGDVSVVHQGDEYRLIVGSLKNPKICLLLGMSADLAAYQVERIRTMGKEENYSESKRFVSFCGECFFFSVTGKGESQTYSFHRLNASQRFSLGAHDINAIKEAILLQYRESYTVSSIDGPDNGYLLVKPDSCPRPVHRREHGGAAEAEGEDVG